jgi:hypothetical protein
MIKIIKTMIYDLLNEPLILAIIIVFITLIILNLAI